MFNTKNNNLTLDLILYTQKTYKKRYYDLIKTILIVET